MNEKEIFEYMKKTVVVLREEARMLGIKGVKKYKKEELVKKILDAIKDNELISNDVDDEELWESEESGESESEIEVKDDIITDIDNNESVIVQEEDDNTSRFTEEERIARKKVYIENAEPGTIVAFKSPNNKIKSAMIIKKSTKNRKFKLETAYGAQFIVLWDDIIWVRSGKKWPKGVYMALKGMSDGQEENI